MKIYAVTRTSRSNSLPMTLPNYFSAIDDNAKTTDPINHSSSAATSTQTTFHPTNTGRTRMNDVEASRTGYLDPIQDEHYVSIQAVDASLVPVQTQTTSGEAPTGSIGTSVRCNYAAPVAERGRLFAKCQKSRRLVRKNGHSNVSMTKVQKKKRRYIRDLFTTIMDLKWRYHVLMFILAFLLSWLLFAVGWLALAHFNGDITRSSDDNATEICLHNVYDFSTALLYSLETQTTIGYGFRVIGPHCHMGTGLLMAQSCVGIFIQCFITGIIFAKIARPKRRAQTIIFSHHAVICIRDGFYNLIFRVGDLRKTHIIGTSIRALLVKSRLTNEGELIPLCQFPLELVTESSVTDSFVFFFWPVTIAHRITQSSPLWNVSAETMLSQHFEVIVILEGTVQASGSLIQIRTSYVPNEIKWGQRLTPLMTHLRDDDECEIDYSSFHCTTPVIMPDCSAEEYSERMATNRVDPVENDYPASFTSPPVLSNEGCNSLRKNSKNTRLQTLFQRNPIGMRLKPRSRKNSAKDEGKGKEVEEINGSSSVANQTSLPPPPTYSSLAMTRADGNHEDLELDSLGTRTTAAMHNESRDTAALDGNPIWSRFSAQVNRAFETSMT